MWRRLVQLLVVLSATPFDARTVATEFFVDPAGSNSSAGTAIAPWKTLQYAADRVGPGDRVNVWPGSYAGFQLATSGTPAAPIEFIAQSNVFITAPVPVRGDGINLEGASHVVIDGFHVAGMPRAGVRSVGFADDLAEDVTIRNVTATNNGKWGIFTGHVDDLLIEDNRTSGSLDEHGIYVSNSGDRPIIRHNVIWGNHGSGIHMNGDLSQGGDGIISGALVSGNIIYDNGTSGSGINMDGVQDSRIENNLVYANHASGISLYQIDAAAPAKNNVIVNNTIRVASNGRWALNIRDGSTGNQAFNNILLNDGSYRGAINISPDSRNGFASDYNAVISRFTIDDGDSVLTLDQWRALAGNENNDDHSFVATAAQLFVEPAAGDYRLTSTSPARDAGTALFAPTVDLDGKTRPLGAKIDIGAYEFGVAPTPGDFNGDGTVDAADYTVWRDGLGGVYTPADYVTWKQHFGETTGGARSRALTVPEPTSILSLAAGLVLFLRRNFHRRRQ